MSIIVRDASININIDKFIDKLLEVQNKPGRPVRMKSEDIMNLNHLVRKLIMSQPMLVDINGPLRVCGDIHGQYYDLLRLFHMCGFPDSDCCYLFLGDYVDRGRQSLECICLLFAYKLRHPNHVTLLRGNHETSLITKVYGFYDECKRRYSIKMWKTFIDTFNCLPIAAIIEDKIFCCHGGLSPELFKPEMETIDDLKYLIREVQRPTDVPDKGLICDLLWSDPWFPEFPTEQFFNELKGWQANERGVSYQFAPDIIDSFLIKYDMMLVIRAHQVVEDGYEFYANRSLVTVFSAPNYCGEFDNAAAVFLLDKVVAMVEEEPTVHLTGSFKILKPRIDLSRWQPSLGPLEKIRNQF